MTTETIIAKLQLRRGELDDLPVLDEAELGYATDRNRLFIGNKSATFKGDGVTKEFLIRDATIIPNQIRVLVDGDESYYDQLATPGTPGYTHSFDGTKLIFGQPPSYNADIVISFNSEIQIFRQHSEKNVTRLDSTNDQFADSNINWDLLLYNTAKMTYSYKTGDKIAIGEIFFITDGETTRLKDVNTESHITFGSFIRDGRFIITYKNNHAATNLFYSLELWNTI